MSFPNITFAPEGKVVTLPLATIPGTAAPAEVPCLLTMGAGILYEEICGHTLQQFDGSTRDACAFVYGCAVGGCARAGLKFDLTFSQFCHAIDPAALARAMALLQDAAAEEDAEEDAEKKS